MGGESPILSRLAVTPVRRFQAKLARCVALVPLMEGGLPDYVRILGPTRKPLQQWPG